MQKKLKLNSYLNASVSSQKGFTLLELMVVIGILGLLLTLVGQNLRGRFKDAQVQAAKIQMNNYQQALEQYHLQTGLYPSTSQGLQALITKPSSGKTPDNYPDGGYLSKKTLEKDPWKNNYRYDCEDYQNYTLSSDGPDGQPNTADDIKTDQQ